MTWQHFVIVLLIVLWRYGVNPQLPNLTPAEFLDAAKNVSTAAAKWGQVADLCLSWHLPVILLVGLIAGMVLMRFLKQGEPK